MHPKDLTGIFTFLQNAEQLKNTLRSGYTSNGRQESVAEHTWRLCLMVSVFEKHFPKLNFKRLIKMCIIHDLGEVIGGDVPAPHQMEDKSESERNDFIKLLSPLPDDLREEFQTLWDEYERASSSEAKLAKAFDKLETILQHNQGENPPDFDYRFNLDYGKGYTSGHPLVVQIRELLDEQTKRRAEKSDK